MATDHHVVLFSGGVGSWAAAKRVVAEQGAASTTLLFTDTNMEDEDLYRFLDDAAADIGVPVTRIADGRTPWEVFHDSRYLGNTRIDPCSKVLKRDLARAWIDALAGSVTVYLGIDWTEIHRYERAVPLWLPHTLRAPLCEEPMIDKQQVFELARDAGLRLPRLYDLGFPHNNCGGFCVKAGQGHFARLLATLPERYAEHEAKEEALRTYLGKDVAILRDRTGGTTKPLTMRALRERIEGGDAIDRDEIGGCGCLLG